VLTASLFLNRLWFTSRSGGSGYVRSVSNYSTSMIRGLDVADLSGHPPRPHDGMN